MTSPAGPAGPLREPTAPDLQWLAFRGLVEAEIGVPLGAYKEPQMKRRLGTVMTRHHLAGWPEFAARIQVDGELLALVRDTLTINVSEFYRQAERFFALQDSVLPRLMSEREPLRIWSAGCSIGCEPYTISMILNEIDPEGAHTVLATDVDQPILVRAQRGTGYHPTEVRAVPEDILEKYFIREANGMFAVKDEVKRRVSFRKHDLLSDSYPKDIDLILCRNVVIYFTEEAKKHIYNGFAEALRAGGLLFVGGSEMIMRSQQLGLSLAGVSMYRRTAA